MLKREELQKQIDDLDSQIADPATPEAERWDLIRRMLFELLNRPLGGHALIPPTTCAK